MLIHICNAIAFQDLKKLLLFLLSTKKNVLKCAICRLLDIIFFLCHDGITVLMHLILKAASKSGFLSSTTLHTFNIFHKINTKYLYRTWCKIFLLFILSIILLFLHSRLKWISNEKFKQVTKENFATWTKLSIFNK